MTSNVLQDNISLMPLRLIFMGTPDFAVPTLPELVAQGHEVAAVYSRPPSPAGPAWPGTEAVAGAASAPSFGIPVFTPSSLKTREAAGAIRARTRPMPRSSSPMA